MRPIPIAFALALLAAPALSQEADEDVTLAAETAAETAVETEAEATDPMAPRPVGDMTLEEFQWIARPIIVFADTPADPRFIEQMELLSERPEPLLDRDVVILYDTDPDARSPIRTALRPRGFALVIMQKDGNVGIRRPSPRDVREITRAIDNFSLRQEELRRGE